MEAWKQHYDRMVVVSLQKYEQPQLWGTRPTSFIGLQNYTKLFTDSTFWDVVTRSEPNPDRPPDGPRVQRARDHP